ncbi:MAG: 4-hydroxythreonine-4-phosphate dehydrogenase PdxA [Victivallaceae bacterium]
MTPPLRIALTMGDPAGIGPELAAKAVAAASLWAGAEPVLYGDPLILRQALARFAPGTTVPIVDTGAVGEAFEVGQAAAACGRAALAAVRCATLDALAGRVDAMVTSPMNKAAVNLAGITFTGHTEFIAELCGVPEVVMMQSAGKLHVAFVTTHVALAQVPALISVERIVRVTRLLREALLEEGVETPLLAMAALNPHAGEDGWMGDEDERVTKKAIAGLRSEKIAVEGPFPPDTLFIPGTLERFDGVISMYHDQGHIPFKMIAFDRGVNSTLGLPVIRTSPDHGTAFGIAGRGVADTGSFFAAVELAIRKARTRRAKR